MSDNFRTLFVVNPQGGAGKVRRQWPDIAITLRRELGDFDDAHTTGPGDATALTRKALRDGYERVVAVGGDGTVNEVVNGFFEDGEAIRPDGVLAVLPLGTGGDFRRTFGLGKDVAETARWLRGRDSRPFDVGRATVTGDGDGGAQEVRYFANIASFGSSGDIVDRVNRSSKVLGGKATFMLSTVRSLLSYENVRIRLTVGEEPAEDRIVNVVAVANGQFFGGGMHIAPMADPCDGRFEVMVVGDVGLAFFARHQGKLYRGEVDGLAEVVHRQGTVVRAEPDDPAKAVLVELDGECGGRLPATFEILPGAIRIHG